jgi:hypothetical protein
MAGSCGDGFNTSEGNDEAKPPRNETGIKRWYEVLEVNAGAELAQIKAAYRAKIARSIILIRLRAWELSYASSPRYTPKRSMPLTLSLSRCATVENDLNQLINAGFEFAGR